MMPAATIQRRMRKMLTVPDADLIGRFRSLTTSAFVSAGTWSLVGLEVREPVITDAAFAANLTNEGGVGGTFRLLRNVTGLWLLHECRRAWALEGHDYSFDQLIALAKQAPSLRSFIEPNDPAFAEPGDMPARVRSHRPGGAN